MGLLGIELNEEEAAKSRKILSSSNIEGKIIAHDFLDWHLNLSSDINLFDAIIGNPPFIRYQYLPEIMQEKTEAIFNNMGLSFTRHTNAWIPFILASIKMLRPNGRIGMIIPSEIFNVIYAQSLRSYLAKSCSKILIIDPEDIWFESTLQGAVILLAEKKETPDQVTKGLAVARTKGLDFASSEPDNYFSEASYLNGRTISSKWTYAFLSPKELSLYTSLEKNEHISRFSTIADVDVGIVTGANNFFLVNEDTVEKFDLSQYAYPMFGRSEHCPGVIYDKKTHYENIKKGLPAYFIWFNSDNTSKLSKLQREYIALGESNNLHTRYKCRIRKPWYFVPSVYTTKIGMLKRSHDCPRLILNKANAFTTDTAYRISSKSIDPATLVYSFANSLTALSAELEGRYYGGGVLELVPSEIERLLMPVTTGVKPDLPALDKIVRGKKPIEYLIAQDSIVLSNIGLSIDDQTSLQNAWNKLRSRRQRL